MRCLVISFSVFLSFSDRKLSHWQLSNWFYYCCRRISLVALHQASLCLCTFFFKQCTQWTKLYENNSFTVLFSRFRKSIKVFCRVLFGQVPFLCGHCYSIVVVVFLDKLGLLTRSALHLLVVFWSFVVYYCICRRFFLLFAVWETNTAVKLPVVASFLWGLVKKELTILESAEKSLLVD